MEVKMVSTSLLSLIACITLVASGATVCTRNINIGYNVNQVSDLASSKAKANWEWGTQAQALLELQDPTISVFSDTAFPSGNIPKQSTGSTTYAKRYIKTSGNTLTAAGAISHRYDSVMLWSDFIYMVPPMLAYQAVATRDQNLLREAVNQISLYRDVLQDKNTGLWRHIAGSRTDAGTWSTGNGWTLGGIARVFATIKYWPTSAGWTTEQQRLAQFAKEIIDGAIKIGPEPRSGLLRNYISTASSFPEAAGTAMIAANIYRLAVLAPDVFAKSQYLGWADARRAAVVKTVGSSGVIAPVINPYKYTENAPYGQVSPEAQSFGVFLYTAYRDCICAGYCQE
ncbi:hypothetical protein N0V95_003100 [Ascochyta clinopodiicola]|nr:hypothetical protein N0V95_003100 [Ascochyta clinopodiicola]